MRSLIVIILVVSKISLVSSQFVQQGTKLVGAGAIGGALQGYSVSLSSDGNTVLIGGYRNDGFAGAAWVFTRNGEVWSQQGNALVGKGAAGVASQGYSVSLSSEGNTALVGGIGDSGNAGAAWVFSRNGGVWDEEGAKLVGTGATGRSLQGSAVSLSSDGNTAIVGAPTDNNNTGAAWIFTRNGSGWVQQGSKLVGMGSDGRPVYQGCSVSVSADGNTAIVGGYHDDGGVGAAWIFTRNGTVWSQQGCKLVGKEAAGYALQGVSVALSSDGNTAIVGGWSDNNGMGAAWVFVRIGSVWSQQDTKLVGSGVAGGAAQGSSVSISSNGTTALVGGYLDSSGTGAVWVFRRSGTAWHQEGKKIVGKGAEGESHQGVCVSLSSDGSTCAAGGHFDSCFTGAVWIFIRSAVGVREDADGKPREFRLMQNYPNPFNPCTTIGYDLPGDTHVRIRLFNVLGQEVATLVDEDQKAGYRSIDWNGSNLASGIYCYRLDARVPESESGVGSGFTGMKKMILLR